MGSPQVVDLGMLQVRLLESSPKLQRLCGYLKLLLLNGPAEITNLFSETIKSTQKHTSLPKRNDDAR